ncbi:MAG: exopolysaccharide biosynthesis protein, partial [Xanthomonadales bacterium]|nr:exopolysaccharide biosynthesis protein [Xanthomonadales bacterium]
MSIRSISELLQDLDSQLSGEHVTLDEVLKGFHERGFGFFLFIFALPTALPLPGLGINLIIALPLLLL